MTLIIRMSFLLFFFYVVLSFVEDFPFCCAGIFLYNRALIYEKVHYKHYGYATSTILVEVMKISDDKISDDSFTESTKMARLPAMAASLFIYFL